MSHEVLPEAQKEFQNEVGFPVILQVQCTTGPYQDQDKNYTLTQSYNFSHLPPEDKAVGLLLLFA